MNILVETSAAALKTKTPIELLLAEVYLISEKSARTGQEQLLNILKTLEFPKDEKS